MPQVLRTLEPQHYLLETLAASTNGRALTNIYINLKTDFTKRIAKQKERIVYLEKILQVIAKRKKQAGCVKNKRITEMYR